MKDPIIRGPLEFSVGDEQYRIIAKGGLHVITGNHDAHFSLTANIDEMRAGAWRDYMGGSCHDEILKHFPELELMSKMHLSDTQGVPMHAFENGWHWMRGACVGMALGLDEKWLPTQDADTCLDYFAKHVRITLTEAEQVRAQLVEVSKAVSHYRRVYERAATEPCKESIRLYVEAQKPRWKREADETIAELGLVRYQS